MKKTPNLTKSNTVIRAVLALFALSVLVATASPKGENNAKTEETDSAAEKTGMGRTAPNPVALTAAEAELAQANLRLDAPSGTNVSVTATAGTMGPTLYANLGAAFAAINVGTHQGAITCDIAGNTVEAATAAINASGTGGALYTSVLVRPSGGARTITGSIVGAVIKLVGADNVTIDGRISGAGRNLTVSNTSNTTATAAIWLTSTGVGAGATNNIIRNLEIACGAPQNTGTLQTMGIIMASNNTAISLTSNSDDCDNNSFIANRIIKCRHGIVTRGTTTNLSLNTVVTDNIVGPTSFGSDEIGHTGILMQADQGATVSRNIVQFVGGDLANTTAGADRLGIAIGSDSWSQVASTTLTSNTYTVTKNIIHDIVEDRTFSAVGIQLATTGGGSPTNNLVANNFIYNMRSNALSPDQLCGIAIPGGHTDKVVFNSIALTGDQDVGVAGLSSGFGQAIRISQPSSGTHANLTVANNSIYLDASCSTATTHYYAITGNSAAYSFGTGFENNNNLYINPANPQLRTGGFAASTGPATGTEFATLANWQAAYTAPQDGASIQAAPLYLSNTSDLHISGTSPNINAGLTIAGVADDIDAQARPNGPNPDIGADEFYAVAGSLQFSSATYAGSEGAMVMVTVTRTGGSSGAVTVDYTLADGSAIGGAACGAGVDYVNPGTQTLMFGNNVTSQSFNVSLCSDVVTDPSETFNLALSNPTGGASIGSPGAATLTITDVPPPLSGSYNVPGDFPSLTNAGGIFERLNLSGASGNITINITADLTAETGANALNELAGGFAVLIRPSLLPKAGDVPLSPRIISGSSAANTGLIKLNGADNVTIDGSGNGGTDGDTNRDLTITNTNDNAVGVWLASVLFPANGANNNTVENCNLTGTTGQGGTIAGVLAGGATFGSPADAPNNNNTIQNNLVTKVQNGVFISGNTAGLDQNWTVTGNTFGSTVVAEKLGFRGMLIGGTQNMTVTNNAIVGVSSSTTTTSTMSGIQVAFVVNGGTVSGNQISDIKQNNPDGWGSNGIFLAQSSTTANLLVANNFVSDVASQGFNGVTSNDNGYGIMIVSGGGYKVFFNSVNLDTNQGVNAAEGITADVNIDVAVATSDGIAFIDNAVANTQTLGTRYAIYDASTAGAASFSTINYNDYFAQNVGFLAGSVRVTLPDWQGATGQDANSLAADPLFVSPTNLHLTCPSPAVNAGTNLLDVLTDADGHLRDAIPDLGAFELVAPQATSVVSRKIHAGIPRDIPLPGVECRTGGLNGDFQVVFNFAGPVTFDSASTSAGTVAMTSGGGTNTIIVDLTGVPNNTAVTVSLNCASDIPDGSGEVSGTMTVLRGDANGNGVVNGSDISQTKSRINQVVDGTNFRSDVNVNGAINASDVALVKASLP